MPPTKSACRTYSSAVHFEYSTGMPPSCNKRSYASSLKSSRIRQATVASRAKHAAVAHTSQSVHAQYAPSKKASKKKSGADVVPPASTPTNLVVYTDGAYTQELGGIGVFFGDNDERNIGAPLPGEPQTSQRAELFAAVRCLETAPTDIGLTIVTDSRYLYKSMTSWHFSWARNGWKKADGSPVLNLDLIKRLLALVDERRRRGTSVAWFKVSSHCGIYGNEKADRLADAGAAANLALSRGRKVDSHA